MFVNPLRTPLVVSGTSVKKTPSGWQADEFFQFTNQALLEFLQGS
jgi:hypothetical protein